MSKAAKAKIAAGQKSRWAERKAEKKAAPPTPAPKKKGRLSAAGRAAISAAAKARWAKKRAAEKP